jgi:hypothetical protein
MQIQLKHIKIWQGGGTINLTQDQEKHLATQLCKTYQLTSDQQICPREKLIELYYSIVAVVSEITCVKHELMTENDKSLYANDVSNMLLRLVSCLYKTV